MWGLVRFLIIPSQERIACVKSTSHMRQNSPILADQSWNSSLRYVGDTAGFSKNMGTTIYGMVAKYWKSVVVGFPNVL